MAYIKFYSHFGFFSLLAASLIRRDDEDYEFVVSKGGVLI